MKPLYRFLLRCKVSLLVGLFMIFYSKNHQSIENFKPSFYEGWLVNTLLSFVTVEQVRFFHSKLKAVQHRIIFYRILLCYIVPISVIVVVNALYATFKETNIVQNGFLNFDLPVILLMLSIFNLSYFIIDKLKI